MRAVADVAGRLSLHAKLALHFDLDLLDRDPAKAVELMARPLVPARGYTLIADMQWRRQARRHGVEELLHARPYEQAEPPHPPA